MSASVAIVGGGITGLCAAYRLQSAGVPVTLYEAGSQAGGVIRTTRRDGYLAECGPNSILETSPAIGGLIRDLGLQERRCDSLPAADKRYLVRAGRPVALPGSPLGFPLTKLFSWKAKLALLREPWVKTSAPEVEESVAEFVRRRLGQEFLDYAINPMVAGIYAGNPSALSVKHAFPKLHALEQRYGSLIKGQILGAKERKRSGTVSKQNAAKLSFDGGLQVLTDTLAEKLGGSLVLQSPVQGLKRSGAGQWIVRHRAGEATHAAVALALPSHQIAAMDLPESEGIAHTQLGDIRYPPVASLVLGFRKEEVAHPLDGFGMLIPEVEGFGVLGTIFSSSLFPGRAPQGHVTLTSYIGGERSPDLASLSTEESVGLALKDLGRLLGVTGKPTFVQHHAYPQAIPQYNVGFGRFKELMASMEKEMPGVFIAGHCRDGISLADSIVSGEQAAERLQDYVKARPGGAKAVEQILVS